MEHCLMRSTFMVNWFMFGISNMRTTFIIEILNNWRYISVFLAFDFCRFCVVTTRFFHPRHNGQWPPTSKYFYTRSYPLHYFLILIREKELVYFIELIYIKELVYVCFHLVVSMLSDHLRVIALIGWLDQGNSCICEMCLVLMQQFTYLCSKDTWHRYVIKTSINIFSLNWKTINWICIICRE